MPKLEFCQIDTKVNSTYEPIEIWSADDENINPTDMGRPMNMHNVEVMENANAEYLNSLLRLQKHIKEKYEHQLILNVKVEGEPDELSFPLYQQFKKLRKQGTSNLYYT
jgi:hypothetical protein